MVFLYTILLTLGIVICNSLSSHASPRPLDERSTQPSFLNRNIPHLLHHSHTPLNTSELPQNHSNPHPLVGTIIPCTSDEKICLRYNMVFVPSAGNCQPVGISGLCNITIARSTVNGINGICDSENINLKISDETKQLDSNKSSDLGKEITMREENKNTTNDGVGLPKENKGIVCSGYINANEGKCHSREEVRDICGCETEPTARVPGGSNCNCEGPSQIHVEQPKRKGFCRIPDLRFPNRYSSSSSSSSSNIFSLSLNCSQDQRDCFSQKKIWMSDVQMCMLPLERGPCPEEHVVALNESVGETGFAEGACVHERGGCPKGFKRLRTDQKCHSDRELEIREMYVGLHPFGLYDTVWNWSPRIVEEEQMCGFRRRPLPSTSQSAAANNVAQPGWGVQNDRGEVFGGTVNSKETNPSLLE